MKQYMEAVSAKLKEARLPFVEQGKNVLRINTEQGVVMLFPATSKWQHHGRLHYGDTPAFIDWVRRKGVKPV